MDSDLHQIISACSHEIKRFLRYIEITKTVITQLVSLLLDRQAILLDSVHNVFKKYVRAIVVAKGIEGPEDVTSMWILE